MHDFVGIVEDEAGEHAADVEVLAVAGEVPEVVYGRSVSWYLYRGFVAHAGEVAFLHYYECGLV